MIIQSSAEAIPASDWVILYKDKFQLGFRDMFYLGLYADLKADVTTKDNSFTTMENLLTVLQSNIELYCVPSVASIIKYAADRLKNHLGFFGKTDKFEEHFHSISQLLKTKMTEEEYKQTQEEAKKVYERHLNNSDLKEAAGQLMDNNIKNHFAVSLSLKEAKKEAKKKDPKKKK